MSQSTPNDTPSAFDQLNDSPIFRKSYTTFRVAQMLLYEAGFNVDEGADEPFEEILSEVEDAMRFFLEMPRKEDAEVARRARIDALKTDAQRRRKSVSAKVRLKIYQRDGFKCVTCGTSERLTLDHIYPVSLGGGNEESNLQTMCLSCNASKGARL